MINIPERDLSLVRGALNRALRDLEVEIEHTNSLNILAKQHLNKEYTDIKNLLDRI